MGRFRRTLKNRVIGLTFVGIAMFFSAVSCTAIRHMGRGIGAVWMMGVKYPAEFPLRQTYHSVVLEESITWVEFVHEGKNRSVDETCELLESAMLAAGYPKFAELDRQKADRVAEGTRGFIFAKEDGRFCFEVHVGEVEEFGATLVRVRSIYRMFSPRQLMIERKLASMIRGEDNPTSNTVNK